MAWSLYRWVWQLQSPLHVGMPPAGSLNRTRLYIPARSIWGALTAEYARSRGDTAPDYERAMAELRQNMRFSYLFPAEPGPEGGWLAWLPRYERACGLVWVREDEERERRSHREMRLQLVIARPATAIDPQTNTAAEGTLRETECLSPRWRSGKPVALVGYVFCHNHRPPDIWDTVREIFLGGDTRYGLGRLKLLCVQKSDLLFSYEVDLQKDEPYIKSERLLAHGEISDSSAAMSGEQEMVAGWDYGQGLWSPGLCWAPGSTATNHDDQPKPMPSWWAVDPDGLWRPLRV